jgi:hypothetical protein
VLKKIYKIFIAVAALIGATAVSYSQDPAVTAAEFNIFDVTPDLFTYEFSLSVERNSESWERFVNGTFQFEMYQLELTENGEVATPMSQYDSDNLRFEMVNDGGRGSELQIADFTAGEQDIVSISAYAVKTQVIKRDDQPTRLSITIQGPPEFEENQFVPANRPGLDTAVVLGRFRITNLLDGFPRMELRWKDELTDFGYFKYLATAYKLNNNITVQGVNNYYIADDNIDFGSPPFQISTSYQNDTTVLGTFLSSFTTRYVGNQVAELKWRTRSEFRARGFRIFRGYKYPFEDDGAIDFDEEPIYVFNKPATDPITRKAPFDYEFIDTGIPAERRGWEVCYRIDWFYLQTETDGEWRSEFDDGTQGIACTGVPNSVISYAHAYPNPFRTKTTIEYTVDDDIYLTAILYDLNGKEVEVVMSDQPVKRGTYSMDLEFPKTATNGIFNLIFFGTPINDTSVEYSNGILKLQKVR